MGRFLLRESNLYPVLSRAFNGFEELNLQFDPEGHLHIIGRDPSSVTLCEATLHRDILEQKERSPLNLTVSEPKFSEALAAGSREEAESAHFTFSEHELQVIVATKQVLVRARLRDIVSGIRRLPLVADFQPDATYTTSEPKKLHSALLFLRSSTRWEEIEDYHVSSEGGNLILEDPSGDLVYSFRDVTIQGRPDSWIQRKHLETVTHVSELQAVYSLELSLANHRVFRFEYECTGMSLVYHVGARLRGD